jgi:hypothetical protein
MRFLNILQLFERIAHKEWVDDHVGHVLNQVEATPEELIAKFTYQLIFF